jgi:hypothetical protein
MRSQLDPQLYSVPSGTSWNDGLALWLPQKRELEQHPKVDGKYCQAVHLLQEVWDQ